MSTVAVVVSSPLKKKALTLSYVVPVEVLIQWEAVLMPRDRVADMSANLLVGSPLG